MDKKLVLIVIEPNESRHGDLKRLLAQEEKLRGHQVIVLSCDPSLSLVPEVPTLDAIVKSVGYSLKRFRLSQTKFLHVYQLNTFQMDKRVRSILKLNRIFVRRSGERFRRRVSFPCCSR